MFKLQYQNFKNNILECILLSGGFVSMDEIVEMVRPIMYDNKRVLSLDTRVGEIVAKGDDDTLYDIPITKMDIESLVTLADHLSNPKNFRIVKSNQTI